MEPTEHDPITRRLHSLGQQPVAPDIAASHRSLMASVPVTAGRSRLRPLMVGSLLAGSLLGGMGLAAAAPGVPDSASDVAKTVLSTVTLGAVDDPGDDADDPAAKAAAEAAKEARKAAKTATGTTGTHGVTRSTVGCPAGFTGNHGQYVSSVAQTPGVTEEQKTAAAQSECGKPVHAPPSASGANADEPKTAGRSGDEQGKPETTDDNGQSGDNGQSDDDHPGDHPNARAGAAVAEHRKADAGRSSGHGPTTTTTTAS
ncbi:MAG TPA: hypothetical protein VMZ51_04925 [Acidimicrobiales bacterium]|nr:hypothetical protein [Acidimicrobiales bacterium]